MKNIVMKGLFLTAAFVSTTMLISCDRKTETTTSSTTTNGIAPPLPPSSQHWESVLSGNASATQSDLILRVKAALDADPNTQELNITVSAPNEGEVTLSGVVDSQAQVNQAVQLAQNTEGVTSVNNQLSVRR